MVVDCVINHFSCVCIFGRVCVRCFVMSNICSRFDDDAATATITLLLPILVDDGRFYDSDVNRAPMLCKTHFDNMHLVHIFQRAL